MKSFAVAMMAIIVIHLIALGAGVGWLWSSGRLNHERIDRVVDMFSITIEEEQQQLEEIARQVEQEQERIDDARRLEKAAEGPVTLQDRLVEDQQTNELAMHRLERLQRETEDLRQQIERAKGLIARQKSELEAKRVEFEEYIEQKTRTMRDKHFLQTVQMYEQLKPKQAKQMFQQLVVEGQTDKVVDYLAAMQLRKASKVLGEFKEPNEVAQAKMLLERLRNRGIQPLVKDLDKDDNET